MLGTDASRTDLESLRLPKVGFVVAFLCAASSAVVAETLPPLSLDPEATTVSGLSSGGFMAVQIQIAYSSAIAGAGVIAGGPYNCADHSIWRALNICMNPLFGRVDPKHTLTTVQTMVADGVIDPSEGLEADRIYLFHGRADDKVARETMDALKETYISLGMPDEGIRYVTSVEAGHGFVTEAGSVQCAETRPNFLIDCDFDQAGDILTELYGPLIDPVEPLESGFVTFNQAAYTQGASGMGALGFLYVPTLCSEGVTCRLHIALHGCNQGREAVGEEYARHTGYNRWAESNGIVVLYPQAAAIPSPWYNWFAGNPNGCWDWWGYSGLDYLSRMAPQPAAIARMAAALGAPLMR